MDQGYSGCMTIDDKIEAMLSRLTTCSFSGHRPQKLPSGRMSDTLKNELDAAIMDAVNQGYTKFVTGGSTGFDTWAAEALIRLRNGGAPISVELAIPCLLQSSCWNGDDKRAYERIKSECDTVLHITNRPYENGCMQRRNRYMVDASSLLICYYTGQPGGTMYTVNYARKNGVDIVNLCKSCAKLGN